MTDIPLAGSSSGPSSRPVVNPDEEEYEEDHLDVVPTRGGRKLCVRHKQMANQNINAKLQKVSFHPWLRMW